jgi:hypothetical protein
MILGAFDLLTMVGTLGGGVAAIFMAWLGYKGATAERETAKRKRREEELAKAKEAGAQEERNKFERDKERVERRKIESDLLKIKATIDKANATQSKELNQEQATRLGPLKAQISRVEKKVEEVVDAANEHEEKDETRHEENKERLDSIEKNLAATIKRNGLKPGDEHDKAAG